MIKTPDFQCRGYGFNPWQGIKILHAMQCGQKSIKKNRKLLNNKRVNVKITGWKSLGLS